MIINVNETAFKHYKRLTIKGLQVLIFFFKCTMFAPPPFIHINFLNIKCKNKTLTVQSKSCGTQVTILLGFFEMGKGYSSNNLRNHENVNIMESDTISISFLSFC